MTSGYLPLGGVLVSGEVAGPFFDEPGGPMLRHGATYAGHATGCAAALCVLDIYEREEDHPARPRARGRAGRGAGAARGASAGERGEGRARPAGRRRAAERDAAAVAKVAAGAREAGVLLRPLLGALAVSPPLIVEREHLEEIATGYRTGLDRLGSGA